MKKSSQKHEIKTIHKKHIKRYYRTIIIIILAIIIFLASTTKENRKNDRKISMGEKITTQKQATPEQIKKASEILKKNQKEIDKNLNQRKEKDDIEALYKFYELIDKSYYNSNGLPHFFPGEFHIAIKETYNNKTITIKKFNEKKQSRDENQSTKTSINEEQKERSKTLQEAHEKFTIESLYNPYIFEDGTPTKITNIYRIKFKKSTVKEVLDHFKKSKYIEFVEPLWAYQFNREEPNDGSLWSLRYLKDKEQGGSDALKAFNAMKNQRITFTQSVVWVADNAFEVWHSDLAWNIIGSYDPADGDSNANPPGWWGRFHGTHVAWSVSSVTNNTTWVPAIAYNTTKMKVAKANGNGFGDSAISHGSAAAEWLAGQWVKVISMSFWGYWWQATRANNMRRNPNILYSSAAGNDNRDAWGFAPAWANAPNNMTVWACWKNWSKAWFSNRWNSVDICAPWTSIYSTTLNNGYRFAQGTSMATPVTSSLAGLLWALRPNLSPEDVIQIIHESGESAPSNVSGKFLNVCNAINHSKVGIPCPYDFDPETNCQDGLDENGDGQTDCDDPSCSVNTTIWNKKICESGSVELDATTANADSYLREPWWETTAKITVSPTETTTYNVTITNTKGCNKKISTTVTVSPSEPEICNDGIDNDCNGATDCSDSACSSTAGCSSWGGGTTPIDPWLPPFQPIARTCNNVWCDRDSTGETNCTDGIDNDADGKADCWINGWEADSNCLCMAICWGTECHCCDGLDNDGDWLKDCEDPDCACRTNRLGKIEHDGVDQDKTPVLNTTNTNPNF